MNLIPDMSSGPISMYVRPTDFKDKHVLKGFAESVPLFGMHCGRGTELGVRRPEFSS